MNEDRWSKVSIFGAGQMGASIAYVCLMAGLQTKLVDPSDDALGAARGKIKGWFEKSVSKGQINQSKVLAFQALLQTQSIEECELAGVQVVIEAVTEDLAIKESTLRFISQRVDVDTIIGSNTSSFSITQLSQFATNPSRVIGMHFMNPAHLVDLVEVVDGLQTSSDVFVRGQHFVESLGKVGVAVRDTPGFVVNRLLIPMLNEAIMLIASADASPVAVDQAMMLGAKHPIGPLALADMIGLDVVLACMDNLHQQFGEDKYRPSALLRRYVAAGWLGRKSGRGFFTYPDKS